jgi:hypothetical protein
MKVDVEKSENKSNERINDEIIIRFLINMNKSYFEN